VDLARDPSAKESLAISGLLEPVIESINGMGSDEKILSDL
jgi:hypothetical protein